MESNSLSLSLSLSLFLWEKTKWRSIHPFSWQHFCVYLTRTRRQGNIFLSSDESLSLTSLTYSKLLVWNVISTSLPAGSCSVAFSQLLLLQGAIQHSQKKKRKKVLDRWVVSRAARQQPPVVPASSTRFIVIILFLSYFFFRIFLWSCWSFSSFESTPRKNNNKKKRSACKWSFLRVSFVFSRIPTTFT